MIIPFSEIVNTQKGKNPTVKSKIKLDGYIPYIDIKAFELGVFDTYTDGNKCLFCDDGDILLVWDGARAGLVGVAYKGAVGSTLVKIDVPLVEKKYVLYFLNYFFRELNVKLKGTGIPHINPTLFYSLPFPLSPLLEQQRIVTKIDSLFSELENGVTLLKTIKAQLVVYKQAVLKWAFEEKGFKFIKMSQVSEAFGGGAFKSADFLISGKYQVIRIGNVRPGIIRYNERPIFLNKLNKNESKYLLEKGDVVITLTGTRKKRDYGFTAIIDKDNLVLNQRVAAIRFYQDYSPKFFLYYSWTNKFKDDFFVDETGNVGQGNVGMKAITETLIPYCSYPEQLAIVSAIESRLSVCDKLEQTIDQTLALSASLRQSILKKAFEGRLVPQDPNDEPAEKLLEKIKAEKAAVLAKLKHRKAKKWKTAKR